MDSLNDDSILSTTPPSAKKQKTAATKKTGGKPLAAVRNEAISFDGSDEPPKAKAGGQSEKYQKV